MQQHYKSLSALTVLLALLAGSVLAQPVGQAAPAAASNANTRVPDAPLAGAPQHPWQASSPSTGAQAYFTNVANNAVIETPFLLKFGLSGDWGLASIATPVPGKSGHHHLLINRDLPLDFKQALPFNEQYIHFGAGQMETMLNLKPGKYSLRLLLADDKHLPHFVFSKPLNLTVSRSNPAADAKSSSPKGIALLNIANDAKLKAPFLAQFHASQLNVGPVNQNNAGAGHFRLTVQPKGNAAPAVLSMTNGQTEAWLRPPPGSYTLKLELMSNADGSRPLAEAATVSVQVE